MSDAAALHGTDEPPPEVRRLAAGPLTVELEGGQLRDVRFGGVEVLRGVAFLVRDAAWGTPPATLADLRVEAPAGGGGFRVAYAARCAGPDGAFAYRARIEGHASGRLAFACEGAPEGGDLRANRVGFVVLHPLDGVAGQPMRVEHTDGTVETVTLPAAVAPDQPVLDVRALTHAPAPGLEATVRLEGDAFEMEDQRNWTDASFKTYVRPLARPRPFIVPAGERLAQAVTLTVAGEAPPAASVAPTVPAARLGPPAGALPAIGLAVDEADAPAALRAAALIRAFAPRHLVCRIDAAADAAPRSLDAYARLRRETGAAVTLELVIPGRDPDAELARAAALCAAAGLAPAAVVPSPAAALKTRPSNAAPPGEARPGAIAAAARAAFPGALLGGGTLASFTELNRNPPPPGAGPDFVTFGTAANVHAADDRSVMGTLEALPHLLRSARALAGGRPLRLGPAAIGMRENPYGASVAPNPRGLRVAMARRDPRHRALFGAAWTLGYAAHAARGGVAAVTLAHVAGDLGLADPAGEGGEGWGVHPLAHVLHGLARAAGAPLLGPPAVAAGLASLAFAGPEGPELWLANLTLVPLATDLPAGAPARAALLDAAALGAARREGLGFLGGALRPRAGARLLLPPLAVARLAG